MNLTKAYRQKNLPENRYWIIEKDCEEPVVRWYEKDLGFTDSFGYPVSPRKIKEVLAPCDYNELQQLKEEKKHLNAAADIATTNYKEALKENKMLSQQLAEHKETCCCFENEKLRLDNQELRQLLKECKEKIHNEFINQDIVSIDNFHELLTRINDVLGNEIQANHVDDTKIQEVLE